MDALNVLNVKASIQRLKVIHDGRLAIMDVNTALRIIDPVRYKVLDGFKTNIVHTQLLERSVDISINGIYCIAIIPGSNQAAVFDIRKKELLYRIGRHHGELECVGIDPQSRYCVTCGQDGRAFIWVLETARLAFTMPHHADFITSVAFSQNGQWVATGSYDRTINILNLYTMHASIKLRGHNSVIISMTFISNVRLLSAEKGGSLIVWDLNHASILYRLPKLNDEITAMCVSDDFRFAFVATKAKYIALYDLVEKKLVEQRYIVLRTPITSLAYIKERTHLSIGTADGEVYFYSLLGNTDEYIQLLEEKQYVKFYHLVQENPFLVYSKSYEHAERVWKETLVEVRNHFENGNVNEAKELLYRFKGIAIKSNLIQQLLKDYEKYALFVSYIKENRYPLAYSLAKQHPSFIESDPYMGMEELWRRSFNKAQTLIMKPDGEEQARQLLAPFRGISEKAPLIQGMFTERRIYEYFKKTIAASDYVKLVELVKQHPFLKELDEYIALMDQMEKLYFLSAKEYKSGECLQARKGYETLVVFPNYMKEAREKLELIKVRNLFFEALQSNNLINAFSYMSMYPSLYETSEAQKMEKLWSRIVDQGQKTAINGNIMDVKKVFNDYLSITAKYSAMGSVFAQCYCVQLEQKLKTATTASEIENGIRNYIAMFGTDGGISAFFEQFVQTFATMTKLSMLKQGSLDLWTPAMLINDICVKSK